MTGAVSDDGGVAHGAQLVEFAEALLGRDDARLGKARDAVKGALGDPGEDRLEVALAYQAGMGCIAPVAVAPSSSALNKAALPSIADDGVIIRSPFDSNSIRTMPK